MTRRALLRAAALGAASLAFPLRLSLRARAAPRPRFFGRAERLALEALCDRILPPDADPGAAALGAASVRRDAADGVRRGRSRACSRAAPSAGANPFPNLFRGTPSQRRPENCFRASVAPTRLQELYWRAEILGSAAAGLPPQLEAQQGGRSRRPARRLPRRGSRRSTRSRWRCSACPSSSSPRGPGRGVPRARRARRVPARPEPRRPQLRRSADPPHARGLLRARPSTAATRGADGWRMIGLEGDTPAARLLALLEPRCAATASARTIPMSTRESPTSSPRTAALAPRPLSADGAKMQANITLFSNFLEPSDPGNMP